MRVQLTNFLINTFKKLIVFSKYNEFSHHKQAKPCVHFQTCPLSFPPHWQQVAVLVLCCLLHPVLMALATSVSFISEHFALPHDFQQWVSHNLQYQIALLLIPFFPVFIFISKVHYDKYTYQTLSHNSFKLFPKLHVPMPSYEHGPSCTISLSVWTIQKWVTFFLKKLSKFIQC